jgi:hypothetical protein
MIQIKSSLAEAIAEITTPYLMSKVHSKHRLSCLRIKITLTCLMAWMGIGVVHAAAQAAQYEGLVVSRATLSDTAKYYTGMLFRSYKDTGAWLAFEVGQKKPIEIEKGLIVKLILFDNTGIGNAFSANITSDQDVQRILGFREYLKSATAEMPTLTKTVKTLCNLLENDLSMYRSGNIRIGGRWSDKLAWERANAKAAASTQIVNGQSYQNPKFVSLKDETLTLAHDGGIAKIAVSNMSAKEKQQIAAALKIDPAMLAPPPPPAPAVAKSMPTPVFEPAVAVKPKPVLPAEPVLPPAPDLPSFIEGESQGHGSSENVAVRHARRQAVADAVKKYLNPSNGSLTSTDLENKVNMNIDSLVDEHEKIAMRSDVRNVVVIIKYRIERNQFVKLLAEMKLIRM